MCLEEIESLIGLQPDWWGKLWIGLVEGTVLMVSVSVVCVMTGVVDVGPVGENCGR